MYFASTTQTDERRVTTMSGTGEPTDRCVGSDQCSGVTGLVLEALMDLAREKERAFDAS